ncbi:hypothetical protein F5Y11DRAFT_138432 [Daldinia sp. FL1419]|nr:hypothetical protein F5Y11DRAFT_138432 [Daldinia sp. FL1419]
MPQVQVMNPDSRVVLAARTDPCSVGPGGHFLSLHIPDITIPQAHPYKGVFEVPGLFRSTRWLSSRHQLSSVSLTERSFPIAPMDRIHPLESVRSAIQKVLPNITVESVSPLPSCRLLRFFSLNISDGRTLVLSLPPPQTLRLLRSERGLNLSETLVTKWILEGVLEPPIKAENTVQKSISFHQQTQDAPENFKPESNLEEELDFRQNVLKFLPVLVAHVSSSIELGSPFNIFEPARGATIKALPTPLTTSERKAVDFQKGQFVRQVSSFISPNGLFGPATAVISPQLPSTDLHAAQLANLGLRSSRTWKQTFHSLLEAALRDAEDMAVTISYEPIRNYFNRLGYLLDGVTTARLVILDAADDLNVLISQNTKTDDDKDGEEQERLLLFQEEKKGKTEDISANIISTQSQVGEGVGSSNTYQTVTVTGLRDWSNCIFGDPLFAEIFSQTPTPEFSHGFYQTPNPAPTPSSTLKPEPVPALPPASHSIPPNDLIEDLVNAPARLLLYECYHATVGVVRQFYRPGPSSSDREIAARRRLATALRRLDEVDDEMTGKRARRPSANVEAWPIKKSKGEVGGESVEGGEVKEEEVYESIKKYGDIQGA